MTSTSSRDGQPAAATVAEYVERFEGLTRERLDEMRDLVLATVPDAHETISYGIPAYKLGGRAFAYFAGWENFVSLYPITDLPPSLESEVAQYRAGKGTARFAHTSPLPRHLVERLLLHMADRAQM